MSQNLSVCNKQCQSILPFYFNYKNFILFSTFWFRVHWVFASLDSLQSHSSCLWFLSRWISLLKVKQGKGTSKTCQARTRPVQSVEIARVCWVLLVLLLTGFLRWNTQERTSIPLSSCSYYSDHLHVYCFYSYSLKVHWSETIWFIIHIDIYKWMGYFLSNQLFVNSQFSWELRIENCFHYQLNSIQHVMEIQLSVSQPQFVSCILWKWSQYQWSKLKNFCVSVSTLYLLNVMDWSLSNITFLHRS